MASITNVTDRWVHVCAVMTTPFTIDLYVNGINVGGSSSGSSFLPMASSIPGDTAKSAYFFANGSVTYRYKGMIDELRLWNRSLTQDEVRQGMCKRLKGNESGLIGYWDFDETTGATVFDKSTSGINGQLKNSPARVFSGAPIGDDSKYQYSSGWTGTTFSFQDNNDLISVNNIRGNPEGLHIYEVKSIPSQTGGLDGSAITQPYFGVFAASLDTDNYFDATHTYNGSTSCKIFSRSDNSVSTWSSSDNPIINVLNHTELVRIAGENADFDLGPDKILCNQSSSILSTGLTDPQFSILWSTGESTSSINVTQSGKYSVKVSGVCGAVKDSVQVSFEPIPLTFDLGPDKILCDQTSTTLSTGATDPLVSVLWNTGQTTSSINVTQSTKYVVRAFNDCGIVKDSLIIQFETIPPPISLGDDQTVCVLKPITLSAVANSTGYQIKWQDNSTGASFQASDFGKYWVSVTNDCGVSSDHYAHQAQTSTWSYS